MRKKRIKKKKTVEPTGSIIALKDWFKPLKNIGVFKKPRARINERREA